jgi:hypothetical protein
LLIFKKYLEIVLCIVYFDIIEYFKIIKILINSINCKINKKIITYLNIRHQIFTK